VPRELVDPPQEAGIGASGAVLNSRVGNGVCGEAMRLELFEQTLLRRFGRAEGRKLICLHGFADDGTAFVPLDGTAATQAFELVACDLPGFGASRPLDGEVSIAALARFVQRLGAALSPDRPIGLIAHSVGAPIAVETALASPRRVAALLSVEGNLTAEDAYFSGRAAGFDDADGFKAHFGDALWEMGGRDKAVRRYSGAVRMADARSMWQLGRDAVARGAGDAFGRAYLGLTARGVATLYLWGRENVPASSAAFIVGHAMSQRAVAGAGHWIMGDAAVEMGETIASFFGAAFRC
jgi:pimeloyl-ACP methyl ester carboxylesterase